MYRTVLSDLVAWKNSPKRKPLLLLGARQVGKTWLLKELGRQEFERTVYVGLDASATARASFEMDLDTNRLLADLALLDGGGPIQADNTLIILDEIQECPRALTSLKYFAENNPSFHVAAAGSLLGVAAHQGTSFPVGKVHTIAVHPLTFGEFLYASGKDGLADRLRAGEFDRLVPFHGELMTALRRYFFVGGMPEAVSAFLPNLDFYAARDVHHDLLAAYDRDFSKHAPLAEIPRLRAIFDSIPIQLARENRRFVYGQAQAGARAKNLELALEWLLDASLVHRVRRVQTPRLPLAAYADEKAFKLFLFDTGLVSTMSDLDPQVLLQGDALFTEYKGALTEQYVLQSLIAAGVTPYYWTNASGAAEVDFVFGSRTITPLEVKAAANTQAKSLRTYSDMYSPPLSLRASARPYKDEGWLVNVPLYAVEQIPKLVEQRKPVRNATDPNQN